MWLSDGRNPGRLVNFVPIWGLVALYLFTSTGCTVFRNYSDNRFWKSIQQQIDTSTTLQKGFSGLVVYEAATGKRLFSYHGDKNFTPASNVKLLTLYSCIQTLGDSVPSFRYILSDSALYLWPMADPTLLHPYFEPTNILERIQTLAGDRTIRLSTGHVSQPHYGKGWMWDDYLDDYQAEITALPVYGNVAQIQYRDKNWTVVPASALDSQRHATQHIEIWRPWHSNTWHFPAIMDSSTTYFREIPVSNTQHRNVKHFEALLGRAVEQVAIPVPGSASVLYSMPIDTVYRRMMQQSDNMLAEHLLLLCGMVLADSLSTAYTIDTITRKWLSTMPSGLKWVDGSGLSRYNQASPEQMIWVLRQLWQSDSRELLSYMDSGKRRSGTLRNMFSSESSPEVFAKTGSMQGVYNLSGYLKTRKFKVLMFSMMHNQFQGPVSGARRSTAEILTRIGNHY
jgi:D-alanyl-D-alanine carboxypeptidase/D-alanyl-D-alanine-endopeptidase (penicillin-binding protein 4)